MKSHELAERVARLQHDLVILSMSNISEERLHEMIDEISDKVAVYASEAERYYPKEEDEDYVRTDYSGTAPKSDYEILKEYGFSPAKAQEIVLDSKRKHPYARQMIELAKGRIKNETQG